MKRRLAGALGLSLLIAGGAWWLYARQFPSAPATEAAVEREIRVSLPQDVRVELELDGDLFFNDPLRAERDPEGGGNYSQQYINLKPGEYKVHVKGPVTRTQRSYWVSVSDAKSRERMIRGEVPAESGYGVLSVTVE